MIKIVVYHHHHPKISLLAYGFLASSFDFINFSNGPMYENSFLCVLHKQTLDYDILTPHGQEKQELENFPSPTKFSMKKEHENNAMSSLLL